MTYGNVIFVGFMGTGKTTVGSALAKDLGIPHRDLDEAIAEREGCSIPELFATKGEQYFRDAESAMLRELLQEKPQVLTTGGGAVLRPENVRLMLSEGTVIALSARSEEHTSELQSPDHLVCRLLLEKRCGDCWTSGKGRMILPRFKSTQPARTCPISWRKYAEGWLKAA